MVAIKTHQANAYLSAMDRLPSAVLLYGGDAGLVAERAQQLAKRLAERDDPPGEIIRLDDASLELEFPSPYLLNAPTVLRVARLAGDDRADTFFRSVTEAFEQELLAFHALVVDGSPPRAGVAEGRADIVTSQRVAERLASQRGLAIRTELPAQT